MKIISTITSIVLVAVLAFSQVACSGTSLLIDALDAVAAVAPTIAGLSPTTQAWLAQIPTFVNASAGIIDGTSPVQIADGVVSLGEAIVNSAPAASIVPAKDAKIIDSALQAVQAFLAIYQSQVSASTPATAKFAARTAGRTYVNLATSSADKSKLKDARSKADKLAKAIVALQK